MNNGKGVRMEKNSVAELNKKIKRVVKPLSEALWNIESARRMLENSLSPEIMSKIEQRKTEIGGF